MRATLIVGSKGARLPCATTCLTDVKSMARPLSIAIIGAGMGGLAAAAALRRVGVDVTVYEQAAQFIRLGAGIQIGCNAMKVLRGLGLEARLREQSFYPRSWNNRDWRTGEVKFDMIFGGSAERKFGAPYLLAHRGDLHAALASAVPDEHVKLSHRLSDWRRSTAASGWLLPMGPSRLRMLSSGLTAFIRL
jgi:2-polyprenyl-6-methoxyphenol hydroxylase-like FAD-dependent oxidoreductase